MSDGARTIENLTQLIDVSRQLGATVELRPLLESIERAALHVLGCERASVFLFDRTTNELYSTFATGVSEIRFPADRGIAGEAALGRVTINVPDAYADPRFNADVDQKTGFRTRSILSLPMTGYDGELMGVLQLLNKASGPFTANDENVAETLGALAGVALQRQLLLEAYAEKQRLEHDLNLAREIQQGALPTGPPSLHGFDIAGWNLPADQTGGDAYDFITADPGRVGVVLGDATGHGIGPALVVVECRALIRALASTTSDLARILGTANSLLKDDLQDNRFVTLCLAFVDAMTSSLTYASAGHGPLLHYRAAADEFVELPVSGPPLGILEGIAYEPGPVVAMAPGDLFVLMTDGFFEYQRLDDEQFGIEAVEDVLRTHRHESSARIIERLYDAVTRFAEGAPQLDDLTIVIVKRAADGS